MWSSACKALDSFFVGLSRHGGGGAIGRMSAEGEGKGLRDQATFDFLPKERFTVV